MFQGLALCQRDIGFSNFIYHINPEDKAISVFHFPTNSAPVSSETALLYLFRLQICSYDNFSALKVPLPAALYRKYGNRWNAGMAQWLEHSPPTNVARARFPDSASYVGWVCWFSTLHQEVFSGYSGFPSPQKPKFDLICVNLLISIYSVPD